MEEHLFTKTLSALVCAIGLYAAVILFQDISAVYNNALNWSGGSILYTSAITAFVALLPISIWAVAYFIYSNKRNYLLVILMLLGHALFVLPSIPVYGLLAVVLIWWFSKYAFQAT